MSTGSSNEDLQKEIINMNEKLKEIIFNNRRLKSRVDELTRENENLYDRIYNTDVNLNNLDIVGRPFLPPPPPL